LLNVQFSNTDSTHVHTSVSLW